GEPRKSNVRVWDARNGRMVHEVPAARRGESDFSADGKHLVTASAGHPTQLWEVGSWRLVREWEYSGGAVFNQDGTVLAIRHTRNTLVTLVDVESGDELMTLTPPQPAVLSALCFSGDGSVLVAACETVPAIQVWDLRAIRARLREMGLDWDSK